MPILRPQPQPRDSWTADVNKWRHGQNITLHAGNLLKGRTIHSFAAFVAQQPTSCSRWITVSIRKYGQLIFHTRKIGFCPTHRRDLLTPTYFIIRSRKGSSRSQRQMTARIVEFTASHWCRICAALLSAELLTSLDKPEWCKCSSLT